MKTNGMEVGLMEWPKDHKGDEVLTMVDPVTQLRMCKTCWNGAHSKNGRCRILQCQCGCYHGKNKGLSPSRPPKRGCEENMKLPDYGSFTV